MTDTPGQDDALSLDSVIDDLLEQASSIATETETPSAPETGGPSASLDAESSAPVVGGQADDGTAHLDESLAASLDDLLKQAGDLQASVSAAAPPVESELAPPPGGAIALEPVTEAAGPGAVDASADPVLEAPGREAGELSEPAGAEPTPSAEAAPVAASADNATTPPSVQSESLASLDAELAALTDDLLAGEVEESTIETPVAAAAVPVSVPVVPHGAASAPTVGGDAPVASVAVETPAPRVRTPRPNPLIKLKPIARKGGAAMLGVIRAALGVVATPLTGNRSLQQSVGWLATYTLFLAGGLWIYLLVFHAPPMPHATQSPSVLQGDGAHGGHGDSSHEEDGHGTGTHDDAHGGEHGDGGDASHGASHDGDDHGAAPAHGSDAHGASDAGGGGHGGGAGGHGSDGHGSVAHDLKVVNGYALSKAAAAKAGGGKADAHGSGGHGAKKDAGHGAKKDSGHGGGH